MQVSYPTLLYPVLPDDSPPQAYHLGGMGCANGVVAVNLVADMIKVGEDKWQKTHAWRRDTCVSYSTITCTCRHGMAVNLACHQIKVGRDTWQVTHACMTTLAPYPLDISRPRMSLLKPSRPAPTAWRCS